MNKRIFLVLLLAGCSAVASNEKTASDKTAPSGEQVFDILFSNLDRRLDQEPLCDVKSATREGKTMTLGEHVATVLSLSHESKNSVTLESSCNPSKHEAESGRIIDIWDCKIEVLEKNTESDFISSSMIAFSTTLDKAVMVKGSLRCF